MPNYRRAFIPGASWFFTVNLFDRRRRLLVDHIGALREAVRETRRRFPFAIDAMVVLPDHLHAVWTLPDGDCDFPVRWRLIKIRFSQSIAKGEWRSEVRQARGERGIWQRRYWEHLIRDERDLTHHIDYCWFNPVKHGLVANVEDWPYSSFHRDNPGPADFTAFEKTLATYARSRGYGEPSERSGAIRHQPHCAEAPAPPAGRRHRCNALPLIAPYVPRPIRPAAAHRHDAARLHPGRSAATLRVAAPLPVPPRGFRCHD